MAETGKNVFVAMSGGVDSSVAATELLENGYNVSGVFMLTCDQSHHAQSDAEKIAGSLGIKLHVLDMRGEFSKVLDYFCGQYRQGRTPNPCVFCNRLIKFNKLLQFAKDNGAEYFATGHYARINKTPDGFGLFQTPNNKDQSYALAMLNREILPHLIFPVGEQTKQQTRQKAHELGLISAERQESQEICFIPDDDYVAVLEKLAPELLREGNIIDSSGKILGTHKGIHRFTIGQRRGLRVAMGKPWYVVHLDAKTNTVTLGPKEELMHKKLIAAGVNWLIDPPGESFRAKIKIRYNHSGLSGTVHVRSGNIEVEFDEKISAITPGQLAVFYTEHACGSRVAGGAWIERAFD
ncbi:MAG: tRNA 2-thiouridine(34) synthase MnmA [Phycisphaerae bacterium]|jgi:tRNA-specific 2-thiouridylase